MCHNIESITLEGKSKTKLYRVNQCTTLVWFQFIHSFLKDVISNVFSNFHELTPLKKGKLMSSFRN